MIAFVKGKVDFINTNSVVIDNNGIGYEVFVTNSTMARVSGAAEVKLYTYFQFKEDNIALYGFYEKEELKMFNLLISVSGIGPKSALNMLSASSPQNLMLAIVAEDINEMSKFPGIGKKTAARLILELKDKIKGGISYESSEILQAGNTSNVESSNKSDAIDALVALGYSRSDAVRSVLSVYDESLLAQDLIKLALKKLSKN
ncbi:MAG: Holliday junction branch migration protein RuvA [Defluviitaleaceae bacterium]|nr:Holliday junction branch migration protein RuvA [Defluviitaleaceae bacterium]